MDKTDKKSMELKIDNGELKTSMIPEDFTDPQILYDKLIAMIKRYHPSGDISQIEKAYKKHMEISAENPESHISSIRCVSVSYLPNWSLIRRL